MTLLEELRRARKVEKAFPGALAQVARDATLRAIEAASEATPPTMDDLSGTNTRTGELKAHWATDSDAEPKRVMRGYETTLANNKQYASYVNDGHRMDRHFVPGLVINDGVLERNMDGTGGIMVGTRTTYVPGLHMTDKAEQAYDETVDAEILRLEAMIG